MLQKLNFNGCIISGLISHALQKGRREMASGAFLLLMGKPASEEAATCHFGVSGSILCVFSVQRPPGGAHFQVLPAGETLSGELVHSQGLDPGSLGHSGPYPQRRRRRRRKRKTSTCWWGRGSPWSATWMKMTCPEVARDPWPFPMLFARWTKSRRKSWRTSATTPERRSITVHWSEPLNNVCRCPRLWETF